jgi:glycerol-3-phosphate dehydrogenase
LLGGVIYYDGQFDDSRLAINLAQTAVDNGATVINYIKSVGFTKDENGLLNGIKLLDVETNEIFIAKGISFINVAGIFVGIVGTGIVTVGYFFNLIY